MDPQATDGGDYIAFDGADKPVEPPKAAQVVPFSQLFAFADATDALLMVTGTAGALAAGLSQPLQILLFGDMINAFNPAGPPPSGDAFRASINDVALNLTIVGTAVIVCCFLQVACWSLTASRQAKRLRGAYMSALLTKEIGWFDVNEPMQLATRVAESTRAIQDGMGRKVGDGLHFMSMAISGITVGLVQGWELTLVLLAFTPVIAVTSFFAMKVIASATQAGIASYGTAGAVAQESLSNICTVHMFNAVDHFVSKYEHALRPSTQAGIKKGLAVGWGTGLMFFSLLCTYAGGSLYAALQVANDRRDGCVGDNCYNGGRVVTVLFAVVMAAMGLGQAGPSVQAIFSARAAAVDVFAVINSPSKIDPLSEEGVTLPTVSGKVELDGVSFAYPSRPDVQVCRNYSLTIEAGETVALVGPSGSGKSTIVALLERFYDPQSGLVKLDGVDVRELNVKWLRAQVGLVGQEPALFATSILENIRHGRPSATEEEVIEAAKLANAYSFITEFPQGFATEVGERGAQLSGGQKQRIAIARAIIKNPPILLLDEATSALDTESEHAVQASLDKLMALSRRTTIIVAHRLSTIRHADKIAVHSGGSIVEIGTHDELMRNPDGHYRLLVESQNRAKDEEPGPDPNLRVKATGGNRADTYSVASTSTLERVESKKDVKEVDADTENSVEDEDVSNVSVARVWMMSMPEWKYLLGGGLGAIVNASVFPLWGLLLTKITVLLFEERTRSDLLSTARHWAYAFVGLGVVFAVSITLQNFGFAVASHRLVSRVCLAAFTAMLRQEVGWFDLDENSSGALVSRLATDSATLQQMTSDTLNQGLVTLTTLVIGFGIAFYYSWEMTLLLVATSPVLIFTSSIQARVVSGSINNSKTNDADTASGTLLSEAMGSIRTVASFGMEKALNSRFALLLDASRQADTKTGVAGGAAFGVAQGMTFFNLSFMFYIGGKWVSDGRITFEDMFMVIMVITLSMVAVGRASENAADQAKVKRAVSRVFRVIDRTPEIDATSSTGKVLSHVAGDIEFKSVAFAYPSRASASVYENYNLKIEAGQTVALVGASGSGKSTAIALMERFYDPAGGSVTLDGIDLREISLPWLRDRISMVSQEPVLFAGTISENIAMGKPGATRQEVEDAAKKANAYEFITNFPSGFGTEVGDRGAQVSGGQKQRIAIARAILRDPEVLLLDEATSALDNESERVVQASLDRLLAQKKRTTIIVAHRLSTIRNADLIAVTKDGAIVEQGTHDQLMALPDGEYKSLVARQVV